MFNAFVVAPNLLLAAGQEGAQAFLSAIRLEDGSAPWEEGLPAAPVKGGLACDHEGRILVSLSHGRISTVATDELFSKGEFDGLRADSIS